MFTNPRYQIRRLLLAVCVCGSLQSATLRGWADDEASAWTNFQRQVKAANPRVVEDTYQRDHTGSPSKQQASQMVAGITAAAMAVMDRGREFEKQFPQSPHCPNVQQALGETLFTDFGSLGLPIPKDRVADVESCTRKLLVNSPNDMQLDMILCRVAGQLPVAQGRALYMELNSDSTPEPAHSMAKSGLRNLGRLGTSPDINFDALDGRAVSLANLKGKVVLVNFWTTTCPPCLQELPDLKQLQARYQAQGLELVGISLDPDREALQRCIQKEHISWPQYFDPAGPTNRLAREFEIVGYPVLWLIDRHGVLRDLNARDDEEAKVQALLKEP